MVQQDTWRTITRHVFQSGEVPFPSLVVISGTRRWGKTTWMRQYSEYLESEKRVTTRWVHYRSELAEALNLAALNGEAVFADDLLLNFNDPLWEVVYRFLEEHPESVFVSSGLDRIPQDTADRFEAWQVDERQLAFSPKELDEVGQANNSIPSPQEASALLERLHGHPYLARRLLQRKREAPSPELLPNPDEPTERLVIQSFEAFGPKKQAESLYLRLLLEGAAFRRFDLTMLEDQRWATTAVLAEQFERLQQSPVGKYELDPVTGRDTFEWSAKAWSSLQEDFSHRATASARMEAFRRTVQSGATTLALYYLLELEAYEEADHYVDERLRRFLLHTPDVVVGQLIALPPAVLQEHPNLALITGEWLTRLGGRPVRARRAYQFALNKLKSQSDRNVLKRFRMLGRKAFCRVSLGDREGASRRLDDLLSLIGTEDDPGPLVTAALRQKAVASCLADELYLPFWTATQLDRHRDALRLSELMGAWQQPDSPTSTATALTVVTERVFAGVDSGHLSGELAYAADSDPLTLLGEGRGEEALAAVRGLEAPRKNSPSRSAAEALALTVRVLQDPTALSLNQIDQIVERSRNFWSDGRPSSFIVQAASLGYLALRRPDLSQTLLAEFDESDEFVRMALGIERLVSGQPCQTLELLGAVGKEGELPRARAVLDVLIAAAYFASGQEEVACGRFKSIWMDTDAELIRYAMRFVPRELFAQFVTCEARFQSQFGELLRQCAQDPHVLTGLRAPCLSKSERETLELLRLGRTYAEVAEARFVSLNTVRTQVKAIYRKLGVRGRAEAIERGEMLGLLG